MVDNVYTCVSYIFIHNEIGHFWEFERMFKKKIKSLENESLIFCNQKIFIFVQKLYDMKKLNYSKIMNYEISRVQRSSFIRNQFIHSYSSKKCENFEKK